MFLSQGLTVQRQTDKQRKSKYLVGLVLGKIIIPSKIHFFDMT